MAHSRVTVIIPSYNRHDLIGAAVRSVLATGYPSLEILIVDDGSREETLAALWELEAAISPVRLLRHGDGGNHGQGATRNLGIAAATGDYVCFLDHDDYLLPHRFATAVPLLDGDPAVDGVHEATAVVIEEGGGERGSAVRPLFSCPCAEPERVLETILRTGAVWHTPSILARRAVLLRVGGFSEQNRYSEDYVLWLKLAAAASLARGSAEPVAVWRAHGESISAGKSPARTIEGNHAALLEAYVWSRSAGVAADKVELLRREIGGRLFHACRQLREARAPGAALRLLLGTARVLPSVLGRRKFWTNLLQATAEVPGQGRGAGSCAA